MIRVRVGDPAAARVDAIVRPVAADFSPVTAAMRRLDEAAGPQPAEQCRQLGEIPPGSAAITAGGALPADYIVHVAVRSSHDNPTPDVVRRGLVNALRRLTDWQLETVAMVPLGTGAGNLDAEEAAALMAPLLVEHLRGAGVPSDMTILVEDEYQRSAFATALARLDEEHDGEG